MKMAGNQAYGIPLPMMEMVLSKLTYTFFTILFFILYSIVVLKQKFIFKVYFQWICTRVMEILHAMDITNTRYLIHKLILIWSSSSKICTKQIQDLDYLQEDVQLMANMGLDAYRFSISWSRLIPGKIWNDTNHFLFLLETAKILFIAQKTPSTRWTQRAKKTITKEEPLQGSIKKLNKKHHQTTKHTTAALTPTTALRKNSNWESQNKSRLHDAKTNNPPSPPIEILPTSQ